MATQVSPWLVELVVILEHPSFLGFLDLTQILMEIRDQNCSNDCVTNLNSSDLRGQNFHFDCHLIMNDVNALIMVSLIDYSDIFGFQLAPSVAAFIAIT